MSNKKPIVAGIVLVAAVVLAGGGFAGIRHLKDKRGAGEQMGMPPEFVNIATSESISWMPTKRLVGTVVAKQMVTVANEISGVVTEVGFESGDEVKPGHTLIKLDTVTELADLASAKAAEKVARAAVEVAQADIAVSKSNLELAQSSQRRFQSAGDSVSKAELDRVNADLNKATSDLERQSAALAQAQAQVEQAQARSEQIQTIINKKTIKAPFHALASMRTVHHGQYLAEGTAIVQLTELTDDIYLDFAVPQEYASRVVPGAVVIANSQVLGDKAVKITVISMDSTVNPVTRNIRVRASVANPGHRLKQGMFIDVEVPVEAPRDYVAIPATAVRRAAFGDHVYVLTPGEQPEGPMVARMRMVALGPDIGGKVIVNSGLSAGEKIAGSGSFKLHDGSKVVEATSKEGASSDHSGEDKAAQEGQKNGVAGATK